MSRNFNPWMIVSMVLLVLFLFSGFGMMGFGGFGCLGSSGYGNGMMSWMFGNGSGYVFGPFMIVGMLIAWGVAVVLLVYFIKMILESFNSSQSNSKNRGKR